MTYIVSGGALNTHSTEIRTRDNAIAPFLTLSVVIVTLPVASRSILRNPKLTPSSRHSDFLFGRQQLKKSPNWRVVAESGNAGRSTPSRLRTKQICHAPNAAPSRGRCRHDTTTAQF